MSTRSEREGKSAEKARHQTILNELMNRPENKRCADCRTLDPRWASWNLGIFICIECSGVHRSIGTHISKVKSVNLDTWTNEQVYNMIQWGNAKANAYWEQALPPNFVPSSNMNSFIRAKYERKEFARGSIPKVPPAAPTTATSPSSASTDVSTSSSSPSSSTTSTPSPSNSTPASPSLSVSNQAALREGDRRAKSLEDLSKEREQKARDRESKLRNVRKTHSSSNSTPSTNSAKEKEIPDSIQVSQEVVSGRNRAEEESLLDLISAFNGPDPNSQKQPSQSQQKQPVTVNDPLDQLQNHTNGNLPLQNGQNSQSQIKSQKANASDLDQLAELFTAPTVSSEPKIPSSFDFTNDGSSSASSSTSSLNSINLMQSSNQKKSSNAILSLYESQQQSPQPQIQPQQFSQQSFHQQFQQKPLYPQGTSLNYATQMSQQKPAFQARSYSN